MKLTVMALPNVSEEPLYPHKRLPLWRPFLISDERPEDLTGFSVMPAGDLNTDLHATLSAALHDQYGWIAVPDNPLSWFELPDTHPAKHALIRSVPRQWRMPKETLALPAVMAIWNVTPDSFSSSADRDLASSVLHAERLLQSGADILDIGAESTRPGADPINSDIEIERLTPNLAWALKQNTRISLDSWRLPTIRFAADKIDILNDIARDYTTPQRDQNVFDIVRNHRLGYVMMAYHEHDHYFSSYNDCIRNIIVQLDGRLCSAFRAGVDLRQIVVDPGIGFGKGLENDLLLMTHAAKDLACLARPVMIAHSRKRCLGLATTRPVEDRDTATAIASALAFEHGAALVRVHEPAAARDALALLNACTPHAFCDKIGGVV